MIEPEIETKGTVAALMIISAVAIGIGMAEHFAILAARDAGHWAGDKLHDAIKGLREKYEAMAKDPAAHGAEIAKLTTHLQSITGHAASGGQVHVTAHDRAGHAVHEYDRAAPAHQADKAASGAHILYR